MPTTSSYYNDLEYPTVNEDASTYGSIINTYLDGLLTKLKAISDRVTNAQTQLGNINRGVNAVDRINTTLAGRIGSSALLPGTNITLLPDPYSGTYTKTTTWPAYTSALSSFSLPTTQAEIAAFDYEGFKDALLSELARIEATVTQAEADILQARKDTCRTKKYIDAYNSGTEQTYYAGDRGGYNDSHIIAEFTISALSGTSSSRTVQLTFSGGVPNNAGAYQINSYADFRSFCSAASIPLNTAITVRNSFTGASGYQGGLSRFGSDTFFTMTIGPTLVEASAGASGSLYDDSSGIGLGTTCGVSIQRYYTATRTVYPTPDLTPCENPNPASIPYFP